MGTVSQGVTFLRQIVAHAAAGASERQGAPPPGWRSRHSLSDAMSGPCHRCNPYVCPSKPLTPDTVTD